MRDSVETAHKPTIRGSRSSARTGVPHRGAAISSTPASSHLNVASEIGWWEEGKELLERVIHAAGDRKGRSRAQSSAHSILAVNATDAAQAHCLVAPAE
jgi:hypothetical protein